jgi:hypothetical protein
MNQLVPINKNDIPNISLDMEHRVILSERQKSALLHERQQVIEDSIHSIQKSFFNLGKALAEIKRFKLYKVDPLYPLWKEYINHRIVPKLHQSTISDYIAIVRMQLEHQDFIKEDDIIALGYKKVKLLKSKLNIIKKEKDPLKRETLSTKFKELYHKSFKEFNGLPYTTYEKIFSFISSDKTNGNIVRKSNNMFNFKLDKKNNKLSIIPKEGNKHLLEELLKKLTQE